MNATPGQAPWRSRFLMWGGSALVGIGIAFLAPCKNPHGSNTASAFWRSGALLPGKSAIDQFEESAGRGLAQLRFPQASPLADSNLRETLRNWMLADPKACLGFLNRNRCAGFLDEDFMAGIIALLDTEAPLHALSLASELDDLSARDLWHRLAFKEAGRRNPKVAFDALLSLPVDLRHDLAEWLADAWATVDGPAAVMNFNRPSPINNASLTVTALFAWAKKDCTAAVEGILDLETEEPSTADFIRSEFFSDSSLASVFAGPLLNRLKANPNDAVALRVLKDIAIHWVGQEPEAALSWAEANSNDWVKNFILEDIGVGLSARNPGKALQLANQLSSDESRRRIYMWVAMGKGGRMPEEALAWAEAIETPMLKTMSMRTALNAALDQHKEEALRLLMQEGNASNWAPTLASVLDNRIRPHDRMNWKWELNPAELAQLKEAIARNIPAERRSDLEKIISRYEAKGK